MLINPVKWDRRFIELCHHVSSWSKDPSTTVGAVIVDDEHNVRAIGYNGFPRGIKDDGRLDNRETKYPMIVHAERNAIATCAKLGVRTEGCTLVCTHMPCSVCCGDIIQAGIKCVVVESSNSDFDSRWLETNQLAIDMFKESGVKLRITNMKDAK